MRAIPEYLLDQTASQLVMTAEAVIYNEGGHKRYEASEALEEAAELVHKAARLIEEADD